MKRKQNLSYYYGKESEQYSFYRIPVMLFKDDRFKGISSDAKLLSDRKSMNAVREDNGYKERRKNLCEVLSLIQGADVKILPDEKNLLRKYFVASRADGTDETDNTDVSDNITPEFYTSVELKEFIPDFNIAKG